MRCDSARLRFPCVLLDGNTFRFYFARPTERLAFKPLSFLPWWMSQYLTSLGSVPTSCLQLISYLLLSAHCFWIACQWSLFCLIICNIQVKVIHLNASDSIGGAARAAYRLHRSILSYGAEHDLYSTMRVTHKLSHDHTVICKAPPPATRRQRIIGI